MTSSKSSLAELAMQRAETWARLRFRDEQDILDAVSTAWEFAQSGKGTPSSIAYYALLRVRSSRQFHQSVRSIDTRLGRIGKHNPEQFDVNELARTGDDPATIAEFRIDFGDWWQTLPAKIRDAAGMLAAGETTTEVAKRLNVTPGAVSQLRARLAKSYASFLSE